MANSNPFGDESLMVKTVRIGFINITGISGVSNKISINTAAHALDGLIVKATVSSDECVIDCQFKVTVGDGVMIHEECQFVSLNDES